MKKLLVPAAALAAVALLVGLVFLLLQRRQAHAPAPVEVVAKVNGIQITLPLFQKKFELFARNLQLPPGESAQALADLKVGFLNKLVEEEILRQEAGRLNLTVTDAEVEQDIARLTRDAPGDSLAVSLKEAGMSREDWKEDRRGKLLIDKLLAREVDNAVAVTPGEVEAWYRTHPEEFHLPEMARARQIMTATEEEAREVRRRALAGDDFASLARQLSRSPDAEKGGDLGTFAKGQMPEEFDEAVFRLPAGTLSQVVKSPYGFHVFLVEERLKARDLPLEEASGEIHGKLFSSKREEVFAQWMKALRGKAQVNLFPERLSSPGLSLPAEAGS